MDWTLLLNALFTVSLALLVMPSVDQEWLRERLRRAEQRWRRAVEIHGLAWTKAARCVMGIDATHLQRQFQMEGHVSYTRLLALPEDVERNHALLVLAEDLPPLSKATVRILPEVLDVKRSA